MGATICVSQEEKKCQTIVTSKEVYIYKKNKTMFLLFVSINEFSGRDKAVLTCVQIKVDTPRVARNQDGGTFSIKA